MPVAVLALRTCNLFAQAPDNLVEQAARQMEILLLKRREVLLLAGKPFRGLGVVLQGRLQAIDHTIDGREVALASIEAGGAFGHVDLLSPQPIEMTWVAMSPVTLAVMAPHDARTLFTHSEMSLSVATDMARQLSEFLGWQKIQSVHPVSARICSWLLLSGQRSAEVVIHTHAELAWRLNTTRESVTRVLQRLQSEDILLREGDSWRIAKPDKLRELAQGEPRAG